MLESSEMSFYLASNSPRRRQLLSLSGWPFTVLAAQVDETAHPGESAQDYVLRLAEAKGRAAATSYSGDLHTPGLFFLAADTVVVDNNAPIDSRLLGKPADEADAERMLRSLRGRTHQVYTALALYQPLENILIRDLCCTDVPMREYSDAEIQTYIASGDPMDKAGAYAIQHAEFHPVENLQGCYANVMGLPLCHLICLLREINLEPHTDLPRACQDELRYDCPVYETILSRGESERRNISSLCK